MTAIYLSVTAIMIVIMFYASVLCEPWELNYTSIYGVKIVSEGRCILAYLVWPVCAAINGACAVLAAFFNRYFFVLSLALTAVCILNLVFIPEYRFMSEVFTK